MANLTRAWDITDPADVDQMKNAALELRDLKTDISERMSIDHYWAEETNTALPNADGFHKQVTLKKLDFQPVSDDGPMLYTKEVNGTLYPFFIDSSGNDVQLFNVSPFLGMEDLVAVDANAAIRTDNAIVAFTEVVDANGDFDGEYFTAPASGDYLFTFWTTCNFSIYVNGALYQSLENQAESDTNINFSEIVVRLNSADRVCVKAQRFLITVPEFTETFKEEIRNLYSFIFMTITRFFG